MFIWNRLGLAIFCSGIKCTIACKHCLEKDCDNLKLTATDTQPVENSDSMLDLNLLIERDAVYMDNLFATIFSGTETDDLLEEAEEDGRT